MHALRHWQSLLRLYRSKSCFLGVMSRCKDEWFVREFCEHYFAEGVDRIILIDDNSRDKSIYENLDERVTVVYADNVLTMDFERVVYRLSRHLFEWLIFVDVDEFISTKRNSRRTVREELENSFAKADCVMVPWVMMAANGRETSPDSLREELTYRWNHDLRHPHETRKFRCRYDEIEVKCIFRPAVYAHVSLHHPRKPEKRHSIVLESIDGEPHNLGSFYSGLREPAIERALLLCYHYRIISIQDCARKIETSDIYHRDVALDEMMRSDHAEVEDISMREKARQQRNEQSRAE